MVVVGKPPVDVDELEEIVVVVVVMGSCPATSRSRALNAAYSLGFPRSCSVRLKTASSFPSRLRMTTSR